jgi:hypothetical protein
MGVPRVSHGWRRAQPAHPLRRRWQGGDGRSQRNPFEFDDPYLLFGGKGEEQHPTPYTFDEWHRLVVGDPKEEHTVMKRINRDGKGKVTMPPLRIILGYGRQ